jgi:DNA-binding transcriptional regulator YhcF (GntR family)
MGHSMKAGINPATTQMVYQHLGGAGFKPARMGAGTWKSLRLGKRIKAIDYGREEEK